MRERYKVFIHEAQSAWVSFRVDFARCSEAVRPHILRKSLIENLNHNLKCLFVYAPDIRITQSNVKKGDLSSVRNNKQ